MSALQLQVVKSLEGLSDYNLRFLLDMINRFMKPVSAIQKSSAEKSARPLGKFKNETFYVDGYDLDEDNEEIARVFGVAEVPSLFVISHRNKASANRPKLH